jgi:hypothetical protein
MYCWAFEALEKNCISQDQKVVICSNLANPPDINSITRKEADPIDKGPAAAQTTQDVPRPENLTEEYLSLYLQVEWAASGSDDDSVASPSKTTGYDDVDVTDANSIYYGKKGQSKYNIEDKLMLFTRFEVLVAKYADECNRVIREMVDKKKTIAKSW